MGDAYSNASDAKARAITYMESKGWQRIPSSTPGFVGWRDPEAPHDTLMFDPAWDVQYERDKKAST